MELLVTLGLALLAGVIMTCMPCTLPVIGLKLKAFAEPQKKYAYIAGVFASFMVLATLSLIIGTGLSLMGFGHYRLILSVVCFLFGLSLLGVWNIPTFGVSGKLGPFGVGILTVALGSSCAVPFLAPAMAYCATSSVIETYLIFAALGVGFSWWTFIPLGGFIGYFRHYLPWIERGCAVMLLAVSVWIFSTLNTSLMIPGLMAVTTVPQVVPELNEPQVTFVTADWCMNCAAMKLTLNDSRVVSRIKELGIKTTFLEYTNRDPRITAFLVANYSKDVPVLRVVTPGGRVTVLSGVWTVTDVLDALH